MKKQVIRFMVCSVVLIAIVCAVPATGFCQAKYPDKPVTLIVPWSPGGSGDMTCRILGASLEKILGQPVVVKNMPGAGSLVGAKAVVDAKPDGYTLGFLGISAAIAQYTSISPVMMDQYTAVSGIINPQLMLLVNSSSPWKTLGEFIAHAKANPEKVKNGNAGAGVIDHLYSSDFANTTGVKLTQVPFKGWGPALTELAGGHIDTVFVAIGPAKPLVEAGKIRPLAIAAPQRHPSYPNIPTMKEGGADVVMDFWESIVVPNGTPKEVIAVLDDALRKSFADAQVQEKIKSSGLDLSYMGTEGINTLRSASDKKVKAMVESLGLKPQ